MLEFLQQDFSFLLFLAIVLAALYPLAKITSRRSQQEIERDLARRSAEARSKEMLSELLSQQENDQLHRLGFLEIKSGRRPGRVYRVPRRPGLIGVYDHGRLAHRLCVGAVDSLPSGDVVLLHKLMIEGDEDNYLNTATELPAFPSLD